MNGSLDDLLSSPHAAVEFPVPDELEDVSTSAGNLSPFLSMNENIISRFAGPDRRRPAAAHPPSTW